MWNTKELMYTGEAQHPIATVMIDGVPVEDIEFEYQADIGSKPLEEMIARGTYKVKIALKSDAYTIAEGARKNRTAYREFPKNSSSCRPTLLPTYKSWRIFPRETCLCSLEPIKSR